MERHDTEEITRRLNEVYATASSEPDPVVSKIAGQSLPKESWSPRSPESQSWRPLEAGAQIEDPCLAAPLPVAALLDAAAADNAVVGALVAKGNPEIQRREAAVAAEAILKVLEARDIAVSADQRQGILRCHDRDRLDRWLRRAVLASSAGEVISEP